ncbi:hypothetical protein DEO72_LG10g2891 [Vigna unguiculata]|uniref:Uncharacterized protein n=1 Tax=Vigna unguiculata TaxID=3917 RepID=A0A4D6ND41_VIGUN|nr:hypothetical protein DEO72_LG10g2891 [Vigna unguiculata]
MQDLDVNCGRIREELDWTTERQEKELYKLGKEDVRQEEKKVKIYMHNTCVHSFYNNKRYFYN